MHYNIVWLCCQIKTFLDCRLGTTFPQNLQKYLECRLTPIFLICFLKLALYLVPDPQKFGHHEKGKLHSKFILLEATFHIPFKKFEIRLQQVTCQKATRRQTRKPEMQPERPNSSQLSDSHTRYFWNPCHLCDLPSTVSSSKNRLMIIQWGSSTPDDHSTRKQCCLLAPKRMQFFSLFWIKWYLTRTAHHFW
jgi:hypothetical protein